MKFSEGSWKIEKRLAGRLPAVFTSNALFFYLLGTILYWEIITKALAQGHVFQIGLWYTFLFSIPMAFLLQLTIDSCGQKKGRVIGPIVLSLIFLIYAFQMVYYQMFSVCFTLYSITEAGRAVGEFTGEAFGMIFKCLPELILLALPIFLFFFLWRRLLTEQPPKNRKWILMGLVLGTQCLAV